MEHVEGLTAPPDESIGVPVQETPQASLAIAPPPAKRRPRRLLVGGIIATLLVLGLGGGGLVANASLSATYSPGRAVTEYLAAQSRGDARYMLANANYLKGDTGADQLFGKDALTSMMALPDNREISNVKVTRVLEVDSTTSNVTVSMTWAGHDRAQTYTVQRDKSRSHYALYNSWLVDIPASTISVALPVQPGSLAVDGVYAPAGAVISVIQGVHTVTMHRTPFYDELNQTADAVDGTATVTFNATLTADAVAAAADSIRDSFRPVNIACDPATAPDCVGHVYKVPANWFYVIPMAGRLVIAYKSLVFTQTGDPTAGMKLVVDTEPGKIQATGVCSMQMVVDGSKTYRYKGTWKETLTWSNGGFSCSGKMFFDAAQG